MEQANWSVLCGTWQMTGATNGLKTVPKKDSLWRTAGRTLILSIKMSEGLEERVGEFAGIPEEMHETQVHRFWSVFSHLHWSEEMVHAWSTSNWFLHIGKDTLEHYIALHLHLFTLANREGRPMHRKR